MHGHGVIMLALPKTNLGGRPTTAPPASGVAERGGPAVPAGIPGGDNGEGGRDGSAASRLRRAVIAMCGACRCLADLVQGKAGREVAHKREVGGGPLVVREVCAPVGQHAAHACHDLAHVFACQPPPAHTTE